MQSQWVWYWKEGGFNWCHASSREEALQKALNFAPGTVLTVDEGSLHVAQPGELDRL